jgi:two-component system cell cycle response regulator
VNLGWAGHEVVEADGGESAWDQYQREHARLIITDWMMPGMNGLDLIRHIRDAQEQSGFSYIIILTALSGKAQVVRGLQAGADDYLTKPYDLDELEARVKIAERILDLQEKLTTSRRQMEVLAMQDTLTGLLNRRAIHDRALAELNRLKRGTAAAPLSVIMLDIDYFKEVNDAFGHEAGDRVLQQIAELLGQQLRSYDGLGRWGGEEFLMLLPGTGVVEAQAVAERIRAAVELTAPTLQPAPFPDGQDPISASLGVATIETFEPDGDHSGSEHWLDELVRAADQALYRAKKEGRNRVFVAGSARRPTPPAAAGQEASHGA